MGLALGKRLQSYIRHLKWALQWPVPTWNLRTQRQSLQAAGVKLPAELSASCVWVRPGVAMMGDQSRRKRGVGNIGTLSLLTS